MTLIDPSIVAATLGISLPDWEKTPPFSALSFTFQGINDGKHYVIRFTESGYTCFIEGELGLRDLNQALDQLGVLGSGPPHYVAPLEAQPTPAIDRVAAAVEEWGFPQPLRDPGEPDVLGWTDGAGTVIKLAVARDGSKMLTMVFLPGQTEPSFGSEGQIGNCVRYLANAWIEAGFPPINARLTLIDGQGDSARANHPSNGGTFA